MKQPPIQMQATILQTRLIEHFATLNTTKHDFKQGITPNPYPVGTSYVLYLLNTGFCTPLTLFRMQDFFKNDVSDADIQQ